MAHLSQAQIDAFTPFAYLASAAYCQLPDPLAWDCGENCQGVPDFVPTAKGGDVDDGGLCECSLCHGSAGAGGGELI